MGGGVGGLIAKPGALPYAPPRAVGQARQPC